MRDEYWGPVENNPLKEMLESIQRMFDEQNKQISELSEKIDSFGKLINELYYEIYGHYPSEE